ncbi:MAG: 5'-methylthioadenosine/adenosylhomocysteine nucleosidase [Spirosomataceae bacterium]
MKKTIFIPLFVLIVAQTFAQRIAILGAMPEEVQLLESQLQNPKTKKILGFSFKTGKLMGKKVVLAETGIGKVNAATVTTLLINQFKPKSIIFTGIAGAVNPSLNQGDVVIGSRLAYHDYGRLTDEGLLTNPTRNPFTKERNDLFFLSDSALVSLSVSAIQKVDLQKVLQGVQPKIIKGTIVTGDTFVASAKATERFAKTLNADATEMEGAAVAQICGQLKIPFLVLRSISDKANDKAPMDIQTFKKIAADNSAIMVKAILENL